MAGGTQVGLLVFEHAEHWKWVDPQAPSLRDLVAQLAEWGYASVRDAVGPVGGAARGAEEARGLSRACALTRSARAAPQFLISRKNLIRIDGVWWRDAYALHWSNVAAARVGDPGTCRLLRAYNMDVDVPCDS